MMSVCWLHDQMYVQWFLDTGLSFKEMLNGLSAVDLWVNPSYHMLLEKCYQIKSVYSFNILWRRVSRKPKTWMITVQTCTGSVTWQRKINFLSVMTIAHWFPLVPKKLLYTHNTNRLTWVCGVKVPTFGFEGLYLPNLEGKWYPRH